MPKRPSRPGKCMNKRWRWLRMTTFCMEILRDFWKKGDTWHQPSWKPNAAANLFHSCRGDIIMLAHCWSAKEESLKQPNIFRGRLASETIMRKPRMQWEKFLRINKKPLRPSIGSSERSGQI